MNERSLVRRIYTEKTIKKVEKKIKLLGINCKYNVIDLLNLRLLIGIAIFVLLLIFNKNGYILAPITLTMESGRNLTKGLLLTSKNIDSELSQEFKKSLEEMSLGKSFSECLNSMKERIPSDTINNAILNIVQSSIFGNNIEESLNNQLDFLRDKHLMEVKSEIGKLPTKISIISVLFFIPIILMVILSPVLVDLVIG